MNTPEAITNPDGILGELTEVFYQNSYVPNRVIAYGSALVAMSMIMGARYRTERDNVAPGIYIAFLGKSGIGKDSVFKNIDLLMRDLSVYGSQGNGMHLLSHLTCAKGSTVEGMQDQLVYLNDRPDILLPMDELGRFLQQTKQDKVNNTIDFIMEMYNKESINIRKLAKDRSKHEEAKIQSIHHPTVNIMAATTMEALSNGINMDYLLDGFINRFLWITVDDYTERTRIDQEHILVGGKLLYKLAGIAKIKKMNKAVDMRIKKPNWVMYGTGAYELYWQIDNDIRLNTTKEKERLFKARVALQAKKIALIMAVSENRKKPVITLDIAQKSIEVALFSANNIRRASAQSLVDDKDYRIVQSMYELLEQEVSTKKAVSKTSFRRLHNYVRHPQKEKLISDMMALYGDKIEMTKVKGPTGAPKTIFYQPGSRKEVQWIKTLEISPKQKTKTIRVTKEVPRPFG